MNIENIKKFVRGRRYRLSLHAEMERDADQITILEIEEALLSQESLILEHYLNDPRGPSCLIFGAASKGRPIHLVCGLGDPDMLIIITVYRPDPSEWIDSRIRKEFS